MRCFRRISLIHYTDGHKSFGNTSFFVNWNSVKDVAQKLPRQVHEAKVLVRYPVRNTAGAAVAQRLAGLKTHDFNVDAEKLRACLGWLCNPRNNRLYTHVGIDEATLASLELSHKDARGRSIQEALDEYEELDARFCSTMNMNPVSTPEIADSLRENCSVSQVIITAMAT